MLVFFIGERASGVNICETFIACILSLLLKLAQRQFGTETTEPFFSPLAPAIFAGFVCCVCKFQKVHLL